jgi:hypothetical protein
MLTANFKVDALMLPDMPTLVRQCFVVCVRYTICYFKMGTTAAMFSRASSSRAAVYRSHEYHTLP